MRISLNSLCEGGCDVAMVRSPRCVIGASVVEASPPWWRERLEGAAMGHVDVRGDGAVASPTSVAGTSGRRASSPLNPVEGEAADMSDVYVPTEAPSGGDAEMSELLRPTELPCDSPSSVADVWLAGYSPTQVAPDESHEVHSAVFPRLRIWHLSMRDMDPIRSRLFPAGYGGVVPSRVFRRRVRL